MAKIHNLIKYLHGLYHTKVPVMIYGEPGVGKTTQVKQLGEILNVATVCKSGNKSDPTDFSGIPYLVDVDDGSGTVNNHTHKEVRYSVPTYVKELKENENGILFFDELPTCPQGVLNALLSIIQDCEFGEFEIPKSIFRIGAGNYNNCLGNQNLSLAMMNRFCKLNYEASAEEYADGIVSGFQNYELAKINTAEEQYRKDAQYRILMSNFIKNNPQYVINVPEDPEDEDGTVQAFPSPRSLTNIISVLKVLDKNEDEYLRNIIDGLIGSGVGGLFMSFYHKNNQNMIDMLEYVGREDAFNIPNPNKHDECYQIISATMFYFKDDPKRFLKLWERVINTFHNKNNKYGKYTAYDNFIMKYLISSIQILCKNGMGDTLRVLKDEVDDWNEMTSLSGEVTEF